MAPWVAIRSTRCPTSMSATFLLAQPQTQHSSPVSPCAGQSDSLSLDLPRPSCNAFSHQLNSTFTVQQKMAWIAASYWGRILRWYLAVMWLLESSWWLKIEENGLIFLNSEWLRPTSFVGMHWVVSFENHSLSAAWLVKRWHTLFCCPFAHITPASTCFAPTLAAASKRMIYFNGVNFCIK